MRYACGIYCDAAVVHSCVGAQSRVGRGRRANFVAPGAYASALSRMGRKPGLGLVHLAAALLRRAFPTVVLRGVRRNRAGGRSEFASRPQRKTARLRLRLWKQGLCAGRGRDGYVGYVIDDAANRGALALRPGIIRKGLSHVAATTGTRDHPYLGL